MRTKPWCEIMEFLADVNVEKQIVQLLISFGFDVRWIPEYNCTLSDEELLKMAENENRILITNDKDFGELVFRQKRNSNGIILIRLKGQNANEKIELVKKLILNHQDKISRHFTTVSKNKIRFVPLEDEK